MEKRKEEKKKRLSKKEEEKTRHERSLSAANDDTEEKKTQHDVVPLSPEGASSAPPRRRRACGGQHARCCSLGERRERFDKGRRREEGELDFYVGDGVVGRRRRHRPEQLRPPVAPLLLLSLLLRSLAARPQAAFHAVGAVPRLRRHLHLHHAVQQGGL